MVRGGVGAPLARAGPLAGLQRAPLTEGRAAEVLRRLRPVKEAVLADMVQAMAAACLLGVLARFQTNQDASRGRVGA